VAGGGVVLTVAAPALLGAYLGAVAWGFGVALVFPAAMSAGGEVPGRAADAIAAVATIGYGGFLLGPPLIGVLGQHVGLGSALLVLPVLAAAIVVLSPALRPHPGASASS
jgi:MFS family permease